MLSRLGGWTKGRILGVEKIQRCSKHIAPLALTHQAVIFQYGIATPMVPEKMLYAAKYVHVRAIPKGSS